ncbi:MAG: chorismate synthase [Candidatus Margulisiibacteriota bacterium]|nr:MAG: chorismate synthase [Candidatus Margulisbacteria bacterium GWD2_39_127]OGI03060.1 MAG: chorismate synthase [Candidatus Margulisbacteria bacterium GWF2_38_17]OGI11611.1 MAG: chorismate synthase [Candidatus Margulisbacteria bacterium GWE2_39_32]PZM79919.1 MAG: chorismate synthase [Candidatus Margulisiibacteriota bacterium]HAR62837.1 chorismate synthase [Candidatus Margulisiibacteriota bacterium]
MRYLTAGESHGKGLVVIIEGIPANLELTAYDINKELAKRQQGYGRGGRMKIETDTVEIISGIRHGKTLGSPISFVIYNKDWENWQETMSVEPIDSESKPISAVRPGHADLPGMLKYNQNDLRNILERSSARETAARVAAGAVAKKYLETFNISIWSHVTQIGSVASTMTNSNSLSYQDICAHLETSELKCLSTEAESRMKSAIDEAKSKGVTLGGIFEIIIDRLPVGLGSHVQWDRKLDGQLAQALMSIQAIKGVEIGMGFEAATLPGNLVHDELFYSEEKGYYRKTNNAGGIEGGISNGNKIILRAAMKPIPTMKHSLQSVDISTKKPVDAHFERSDNCAVPAASVVGENVVAITLANALIEKLGGDYIEEQLARFSLLKKK